MRSDRTRSLASLSLSVGSISLSLLLSPCSLSLPTMAAAKKKDDGEPLGLGATADSKGGAHSEVNKWLGSASFPTQRRSSGPPTQEFQISPAWRAARAVAKSIHVDPEGGHQWASSLGEFAAQCLV